MDFLKQFTDKDDDHRKPAPAAAVPQAEPREERGLLDRIQSFGQPHGNAVAAATTHVVPDHQRTESGGFMGKLANFVEEHQHPTPAHAVPTPVVAPASVKREEDHGLLGKLSELGIGSRHEPPSPVVAAAPPKEESLFDKLSDLATGRKTPPPPPPPVVVKEEESLFDKISDIATGRKTPPPASVAPAKDHSFLGKLEDLAGVKKTPEVQQDKHWLDKVNELATGNKPPPAKDPSFMGKIDGLLGGGKKAEQKEGTLDKAIDMVQEHLFKQGPQHQETALEQAKDKQIADAIRRVTGRGEKDDGERR